MPSSANSPKILGPDGKPWVDTRRGNRGNGRVVREGAESTIVRAISGYRIPPASRARDPLSNHAVFLAAVMIRALNFSQLPLGVYEETPETQSRRANEYVRRTGLPWAPKRGRRRTAYARHLTRSANPSRFSGARSKSLDPFFDHPLSITLSRPNPFLMLPDLLALTSIWLDTRGEAFWLKLSDTGERVQPDQLPGEIWVLNPDRLVEVLDRKTNRLIAWDYTASPIDVKTGGSTKLRFLPGEIVQFKRPNPANPYRGLSPVSALASGIEMDFAIDATNRGIIENNLDPGGIFIWEDGTLSKPQRRQFNKQLEARYSGPADRRRYLVLDQGWKYESKALTPEDMQHLESKRWSRESILSVLRVPKSVIGITDDLNYATQRGQDKNFWDKSIIPDASRIELTIDQSLLYDEPDTVVAAFDYSGVEALREGLREQIDSAKAMCGTELHTPPSVAYRAVGLDVEEYAGIEVALVNGLAATPIDQVLNPVEDDPPTFPELPADPDNPDDPEDPDNPDAPTEPEVEAVKRVFANTFRGARVAKARSGFDKVQAKSEKAMSRNWSAWIGRERSLQLRKFDEVARENRYAPERVREALASALRIDEDFDAVLRMPTADQFLLRLGDLQSRIRSEFRPSYLQALSGAFDSFAEEIDGVPIFELDDPRVISAITERTRVIVSGPPVTLQRRLRESLADGIRDGESIQDLRVRVSQIFDISRSAPKTLSIARTESAGFLNTARERMFEAQEISRAGWSTSQDEHVRETHQWFGRQKAQALGTNYLELDGYPGKASGTLAFPGDSRASASEVVNCRCTRVID